MSDQTKRCPFCGEEIKANAIKCKHCGEFIDSNETTQAEEKVPRYTRPNKNKVNGWLIGAIVFALLVLFGLYLESTEQKSSETSQDIQNQPQQEEIVEAIMEEPEAVEPQEECVLKLGKTCYKRPFKIDPSEAMTFMECMDTGGSLGIKACHYERDIWAGIVKKCGGVQNMPTVEELLALSEYMYGVKVERCPFFGEDATYSEVVECWGKYDDLPRNDNLEFVQMMKNMVFPYPPHDRNSYEAQQKWGFRIWAAKEQSGYFGYAGNYGQKGTGIGGDWDRTSDGPWGMCVSRE